MARKKYSAKERKAYHMGRAYGTAKLGKRVKCPDEKTKRSFRNGVNSVKGNTPATGNNRANGFCVVSPVKDGYIVDLDGVPVKAIIDGK